jgi:hypothetical protein
VPEHQQLRILRQVPAEHQDGQAEYPAREQVDDLEQHPASQPPLCPSCWPQRTSTTQSSIRAAHDGIMHTSVAGLLGAADAPASGRGAAADARRRRVAAVRMLPTLGGATPGGAVDAPPNVTVCDFGSHHRVLPHMAAVIAHGGVSTVTAALAAGVRLICIPRGRAQPLSAGTVEACCAGPAVACDVIAATVDATLRDAPASAAARRVRGRERGTRRRREAAPCCDAVHWNSVPDGGGDCVVLFTAMVRVQRHRRLCCRVREVGSRGPRGKHEMLRRPGAPAPARLPPPSSLPCRHVTRPGVPARQAFRP